MACVDAAEKEASEVLQSLLSVERIAKQEQIGAEEGGENSAVGIRTTEADPQMQWLMFSTPDTNPHFHNQQVIWEGHTIQTEFESPVTVPTEVISTEVEVPSIKRAPSPKQAKQKSSPKDKKKPPKKKKKGNPGSFGNEPTKLEENSTQVKERFRRGCECQDESCFRGLNPESVYKHRLNIAELTKAEHDMYLMGVTMACLANPDETVRHKERQRLRAQYVYQGRRVCLDAFLYLENCTHYQLKRIRKHVMTHGVTPRIHGNHGKKPHNTFPLDIYRHATDFLKHYLETYIGDSAAANSKQAVHLPWDITRKNLHDSYLEYGQILEPGVKLMGYSTFRHFLKEQFPHVKFCKVEPKNNSNNSMQQQVKQDDPSTQQIHIQQQQVVQPPHELQKQPQQQPPTAPPPIIDHRSRDQAQPQQHIQKQPITTEVQQVIPLVVAQNDGTGTVQHHHQTAFLVTSVPPHQIIQSGNIMQAQNVGGHAAANTFSYQLADTSYVINEQGNIVNTMVNAAQHHTPYTFTRM